MSVQVEVEGMTWSCSVRHCRLSTNYSTSISKRTLAAVISKFLRRRQPPGPPSSFPSPASPGSSISSITMSTRTIRMSSARNCSSTPRHLSLSLSPYPFHLCHPPHNFFFPSLSLQVFYFDIGENRRGRFLKVLLSALKKYIFLQFWVVRS